VCDSVMKRPFTGGMLRFSDYVGTASFAITGCLTASSVGMDVLGCTIVGTITAVGGGTVRDVLLGKGKCFNRSRSGAQRFRFTLDWNRSKSLLDGRDGVPVDLHRVQRSHVLLLGCKRSVPP
jgi:hypothetical protein